MFLVGLTGGIASGKSTVSNVLRDLGCVIIDADKIAREGKSMLYRGIGDHSLIVLVYTCVCSLPKWKKDTISV